MLKYFTFFYFSYYCMRITPPTEARIEITENDLPLVPDAMRALLGNKEIRDALVARDNSRDGLVGSSLRAADFALEQYELARAKVSKLLPLNRPMGLGLTHETIERNQDGLSFYLRRYAENVRFILGEEETGVPPLRNSRGPNLRIASGIISELDANKPDLTMIGRVGVVSFRGGGIDSNDNTDRAGLWKFGPVKQQHYTGRKSDAEFLGVGNRLELGNSVSSISPDTSNTGIYVFPRPVLVGEPHELEADRWVYVGRPQYAPDDYHNFDWKGVLRKIDGVDVAGANTWKFLDEYGVWVSPYSSRK